MVSRVWLRGWTYLRAWKSLWSACPTTTLPFRSLRICEQTKERGEGPTVKEAQATCCRPDHRGVDPCEGWQHGEGNLEPHTQPRCLKSKARPFDLPRPGAHVSPLTSKSALSTGWLGACEEVTRGVSLLVNQYKQLCPAGAGSPLSAWKTSPPSPSPPNSCTSGGLPHHCPGNMRTLWFSPVVERTGHIC